VRRGCRYGLKWAQEKHHKDSRPRECGPASRFELVKNEPTDGNGDAINGGDEAFSKVGGAAIYHPAAVKRLLGIVWIVVMPAAAAPHLRSCPARGYEKDSHAWRHVIFPAGAEIVQSYFLWYLIDEGVCCRRRKHPDAHLLFTAMLAPSKERE
jgi:hypothetical protein